MLDLAGVVGREVELQEELPVVQVGAVQRSGRSKVLVFWVPSGRLDVVGGKGLEAAERQEGLLGV
jgi:hypothetical protein